MNEENVIQKAELNPVVKKYWLMGTVMITCITIVGIPFLIIIIPLLLLLMTPYFKSIECILTEKSVIMRKGIITKTEKTVPLEKITDVSLNQGPIMRLWNLHKISIETAGSNQEGQAFLSITGIKDTIAFRNAIFKQKEIFLNKNQDTSSSSKSVTISNNQCDTSSTELLTEILATLKSIELKLDKS